MKNEAKLALENSLNKPCGTPCTWREDRDVYIEEMRSKFLKCTIEPVEVKAVATEWAQKYCNADSQIHNLVAVAHEDDRWLLYIPSQEEFVLAHGSVDKSPLKIFRGIGLAWDDALGEWLS